MYYCLPHSSLLVIILSVLISYSIGCLNSAFYLTKILAKKDIREEYSHNAGATNTGRILGKFGFIAVLFIDIIRGYVGIIAGEIILNTDQFSGLLLFSIVLGHIYPIQLKFKGGKGISCLIGGLLAISWLLVLLFMLIFSVIFLITRKKISSVITTLILFPIGLYFFNTSTMIIVPSIFTTALIIYTYYRMNKEVLQKH